MRAPFDIDALLHLSKAFRQPLDVMGEPRHDGLGKTLSACVMGVQRVRDWFNPALRAAATGNVVSYDHIIDALQSLDSERSSETATHTFKHRQRRRRWTMWKSREGQSDDVM